MTQQSRLRRSHRSATLMSPVNGDKLTLFIVPKYGARIVSAAFSKSGTGSATVKIVALNERDDSSGALYISQNIATTAVVREEITTSQILPNKVVVMTVNDVVGIVNEVHVTLEWVDEN